MCACVLGRARVTLGIVADDAPLVVVGHTNPDTDSVCSAVAYARYKSARGVTAAPYRAGNLNAQTRFVFDHFGCSPPDLLTDLYPKLQDIMIPHESLYLLHPQEPLSRAARVILDKGFAFLPVVDDDGFCLGKVTVLRIAGLLDQLPLRAKGVPVETAIAEAMGAPVSGYLESPEPTFVTADLVRDVEHRINQYNVGGFIVNDDAGRIAGIIARVNFLNKARFRVALVDHNEFSQAVDGIEEAEVVEVIDHHRIGARSTAMPITFINRVLGSTATIVADMFRSDGIGVDPQTAGLLLSAILSDTVILKSPTATPVDAEVAGWLAETAGVDLHAYGEKMFQAGSEVAGLSADQIVGQDQKHYEEGGFRFAVSQIEMVGFKVFEERAGEIRDAVARTRSANGLDFACLMVTDITRETTRLVFEGPQRIQDAVQYPAVAQGVFEMKGVLSRKKQVLPYLMDVLSAL